MRAIITGNSSNGSTKTAGFFLMLISVPLLVFGFGALLKALVAALNYRDGVLESAVGNWALAMASPALLFFFGILWIGAADRSGRIDHFMGRFFGFLRKLLPIQSTVAFVISVKAVGEVVKVGEFRILGIVMMLITIVSLLRFGGLAVHCFSADFSADKEKSV